MPFKKIKSAFKKITKPVAKVLDKVVPNEIKPFLPYAAAAAPYLLPAGIAGGSGIGALLRRAALTGGLNLGAQLSQEGSEGDFSALSLGLAGLQGALTAPGAAETFRAGQTIQGSPFGDVALESADATLTGGGVLESAKNIGLEGLATGAEKISGIMSAAKDNPISMAGLKAASIPFTQGSMDLGIATARKALQDYEAELAAFNAQAGIDQAASDADRRSAIIASMTRADFPQNIIDETLDQLGLKDGGIARLGFDNGGDVEYDNIDTIEAYAKRLADEEDISYKEALERAKKEMPGKKSFFEKFGEAMDVFRPGAGLTGYANGGDVDFGGIKEAIKGIAQNNMEEGVTQMYVSDSAGVIPLKGGDAVTGRTMEMMAMGAIEPYGKNDFRDPDGYERFIDILTKEQDKNKELNEEGMKKGGLASYKDGGIMNLGGKEMDMRTGGFIPIGAKERADDVPARLSKNEFVMTADAVRGAGNGSIEKGAQKMYDTMKNLERRVV